MEQKKIILIAGPTASGKSKLAVKLAQYFNGEIINADSMQIYKEISILTSKPSPQDIKIIKKPSSPEDVPYTSANLSNTKKLINWHPKTKIDQGLDKTFNWHVENKEWLKKIKTY